MSLRRRVGAEFSAAWIVDLLSINMVVGCFCLWFMSWSSRRSQSVCCAASDAATYSASHVDSATMSWGEEVHAMGAYPTVYRIPMMAFGICVVGVTVCAQADG